MWQCPINLLPLSLAKGVRHENNIPTDTRHLKQTLKNINGIKISGGQKQRIGIARGFYLNSDIIILDEATNAIDLDTVEKIYKNISTYAKNKTILVTSHHDYFDNFFNNKIDIGNLND